MRQLLCSNDYCCPFQTEKCGLRLRKSVDPKVLANELAELLAGTAYIMGGTLAHFDVHVKLNMRKVPLSTSAHLLYFNSLVLSLSSLLSTGDH